MGNIKVIDPVTLGATTRVLSYAELARLEGNGQATQIADIMGISTHHNVFQMHGEDPCVYVYVVSPDGGPVGALSRWATTPRAMLVFKTNEEAVRWAVEHALQEVRDEQS